MNIKKKKIDNLHFLPNNILTRLFKEFLKKYKMTVGMKAQIRILGLGP